MASAKQKQIALRAYLQLWLIRDKPVNTDPHVLVDKTKSASEGLDTIHIKPATGKRAIYIEKEIAFSEDEFNTSPDLSIFDDAKAKIKLEDLSKLVLNLEVDFMDLDSPKNDQPIIVEDEEDEEVHTDKDQAKNFHTKDPKETDDASASQPPSPKTVKIQEPSTRLLLLQTLNSKLVKEKNVDETEASLLKAKPSFPNVEQLTELLVKSIKYELSKLLTSHYFSNSLPTELKELPSKFTNLTRVKELKKYVEKLEVKLPGDLKEIPSKLEKFTSTAKVETLDALPIPQKALLKLRGAYQERQGQDNMSSKDAKEKDTRSYSNEDANLTATKQIKEQKRIEESVKADLAKQEEKLGRHELVDLLGIDVVKGFYKAKLQYDKHYDRMLNRRVQSRIKNYDVLTRKGPITLKDPLDKLNDLARKKRKHAYDIHDYFRSTKKFKSSV
ncbi:hypothetical protein Tco_1092893 [Tanacetum coccineum]|uniref:Uncharacterized protein n=1 Tax=Tanacetum coccineum TaxID=301880 RepID=A0ABQ5IBH0_9ASTR